jgi:hypothetical protein
MVLPDPQVFKAKRAYPGLELPAYRGHKEFKGKQVLKAYRDYRARQVSV